MVRAFIVVSFLGAAVIVGCIGSKTSCIPPGTTVSIGRTNGTGACPADVTAGVVLVTQSLTLAKGASCGMDHFGVNITFIDQIGSGSPCQGSDMISISDVGSDGSDGTDVMNITCTNGVACVETFDTTFMP